MSTFPQRTESFLGTLALFASPPMLALLDAVQRIAQSQTSVLIEGETGSGKEIIARALHCFSRRAAKPWVDISCAALPEHLVESELFGYEKGAFSGALTSKTGLFELANGGSFFLDEVGELPPQLQVKLLRVLDGSPYYRLGGTRKVTVDVRVIAATNRQLRDLTRGNGFREDLYFRLNQIRLYVPPLRERIEDIGPLARHFLSLTAPGMSISAGALQKLQQFRWPGNVRELRNVVTKAAVLNQSDRLLATDIQFEDQSYETGTGRPVSNRSGLALVDLERNAVLSALQSTQGHQSKAATALGISRRTLSRKLRVYRDGDVSAQSA